MKRITIITLIVLTMVAATAIAQPRPHAGPGGPPPQGAQGPGGPRGPEMSPQMLAEFLDLTEAQISAAQALRDAARATIEPLHATMQTNREALEAAVKAGDAAKAGTLAVANYQIAQQIKAARDASRTKFEALLNAEQKAKLAILEELKELRHNRGPRE